MSTCVENELGERGTTGTARHAHRARALVRLKSHQNEKPDTDGKPDLSGRRHPEPQEVGGGRAGKGERLFFPLHPLCCETV